MKMTVVLEREIDRLKQQLASGGAGDLTADARKVGDVNVLSIAVDAGDAKVLRGVIDVDDVYLTFGKRLRIPFETLEPNLGMGAGLHILFSNDKSEERKLHGARFGVTLDIGAAYKITDKIAIGPNIKYVFTVKRVYWHNPFVPHVHKDIFHYFIFNIHSRFSVD